MQTLRDHHAAPGAVTHKDMMPAHTPPHDFRLLTTELALRPGDSVLRLLAEHGRYHGLRGRIVRAFQRLGYDETTLEIYDEALRNSDLLLQVPVRRADRHNVAGLLQHHHVHDVGYFGPGTFEQFSSADAG